MDFNNSRAGRLGYVVARVALQHVCLPVAYSVFPEFSICIHPRRGTAGTHPIVVLFYVLFVLYLSMYCLCVNVYYCHRVTTQLQLTNISSYHLL